MLLRCREEAPLQEGPLQPCWEAPLQEVPLASSLQEEVLRPMACKEAEAAPLEQVRIYPALEQRCPTSLRRASASGARERPRPASQT